MSMLNGLLTPGPSRTERCPSLPPEISRIPPKQLALCGDLALYSKLTAHAGIQYLFVFTWFTRAAASSLVRNGINGDQFNNWQLSFTVNNYVPLCGNSWLPSDPNFWSNSPECEQAFSVFNTTSDGYLIFDTTGVPANTGDIGQGQGRCYCLALIQNDGVSVVSMCFLIGRDGEVVLDGDTAKGVRDIELSTDKALPQCKDLDMVTRSNTQTKMSTSTAPTVFTTHTETPTATEMPIDTYYQTAATPTKTTPTTATPTSTASPSGGGGFSQSDKLAIALSLGIGLPTIFLMLIQICLRG
ncbi:hypothetical protein K440DRAFT_642083 [Wilcoxina mikolae CBS 423.85]|nr:hypothetical protein K440DRAFT_642083 [Wilcoxina mikolae CBS 423.85]